jgi:hypothetical protein
MGMAMKNFLSATTEEPLMKTRRFKEQQILPILRQAEDGFPVA